MAGPPADAPLGERISFEGIEQGTAATPNQLNKSQGKKALEGILTSGDLAVRTHRLCRCAETYATFGFVDKLRS